MTLGIELGQRRAGTLGLALARGEFRPLNLQVMTQVLIAPLLMLITWKHSVGPCDQNQMDPLAFLEAFLDMTLHGLLPAPAAVAPRAA